jgi:alanine racemase
VNESAQQIELRADGHLAGSSASALEAGAAFKPRSAGSPPVIFETDCELVRFGIFMDGRCPSRESGLFPMLRRKTGGIELEPFTSWRATIDRNRTVESADSIGYGGAWTARRPVQLTVIPVASADGYSRALGHRSRMAIRGCSAPRVRRVSIGFMAADVTDIEGVEMTFIARQSRDASPIEEPAGLMGSLRCDVPAGLSPAIPRAVV